MVIGAFLASLPCLLHADIDPLSGIDLVRIGAVGNQPWMGDGSLDDRAIGRGGVNYEYAIGRFEVTTGQWVEFFNAAYDRPSNDPIPHLIPPQNWGAVPTTPNTAGGRRWQVPAGNEMRPVGDISWRMAAIYCNWLHNGKAANREAFLSGAYDAGTFGYNGNIFTDQLAHSPEARYWIPTWDEWLKAVHYDPNRFGEGLGGWWKGPQSSDGIPTGGPPGQARANWRVFPGWQEIPLGAYPFTSPWGLYDTSGATAEWTESIIQSTISGVRWRIFDGSYWNSGSSGGLDLIRVEGGDFPNIPIYPYGFRIAAFVPAPGTCIPVAAAILWLARRQRRVPPSPTSAGYLR